MHPYAQTPPAPKPAPDHEHDFQLLEVRAPRPGPQLAIGECSVCGEKATLRKFDGETWTARRPKKEHQNPRGT